jgi:uncharacterized membrane protein YfcA
VLDLLALAGVGLLAGILSGLFGVGGGFILVPLLALLGWSLAMAVGTSLFYVAVIGTGGAIAHFRNRNLDGKFVVKFLIFAMVGAQIGALMSESFPDWGLSVAFAAFLTFLAVSMGRPTAPKENAGAKASWGKIAGVGSAVGVLSGLFGVGGGVMFVPAQVRIFGVPIKLAVGNSMLVVLLTGLSGVVGHAMLGNVAWREGGVVIVGGLVGLRLGLWLMSRLSSNRLRVVLVAFLATMALYMFVRGVFPFVQPWVSGTALGDSMGAPANDRR